MKRRLVTAAVCLALGLTAVAQRNPSDAPATQADIERYLDVIHAHDMMNQTVDAMSGPMHKMIHERYLKEKDKLPADFEARMNKMMDGMLKDMPFDEMMQAMVPVYQKHLTKGDVDQLVAFYSSPTGQKLLREMPAIMAESMNEAMPIMQKHMEKVSQHMEDEIAALLKESEKQPTPSSSNKSR